MTNTGWPSFYLEETTEHATSAQTVVTSMVMEGLFERLPALKIIMIECGFGWLPSLGWRLDKLWTTMRDEVPHLTRPPSEYIREHFYVSTQPMEEPDDPAHLRDTCAGSASTASCSPPTTRTGNSTIPSWRFRNFLRRGAANDFRRQCEEAVRAGIPA